MDVDYDGGKINPVEELTTRLNSTFNHNISVMDGKLALGENTEEEYSPFFEQIKEYRKVLNA